MKKIIILLLIVTWQVKSQINPGLLLGLTTATTAEIDASSLMEEGQLLYNTDTEELMVYNGTNWINSSNSNWLYNGNVIDSGSFLGATNDIKMEFRSNNVPVLQFGRRQTLGLTQNYPDYNDNEQYVTLVTGENGVSALQFQADAADFYKPMLFTNTEGNFRLKGSAASTDFFEIGSAGISNAGEVEFIIGDDGAEPFIFKRYDYRDQLNKELFRIQGSSDTQDALPRIGINTGELANSTLEINGSFSTSITAANSNIILDETHYSVLVNSNSTITLPNANTCEGRQYNIKNNTNNAISISSFLDNYGTNTSTISANSGIQLQSDGNNWYAIFSEKNTTASVDADNLITNGSDGGAFLNINQGARWTNTDITTNLNISSIDAPIFGDEDYNDDNTLYNSSSNSLTVTASGRYDIRANISVLGINTGGTAARTNVNAQITINGIPIGALGASGYIRFASGHDHSSIHISEILQLNANDVIRIQTYREANSGTVNFNGTGNSSFTINKIK